MSFVRTAAMRDAGPYLWQAAVFLSLVAGVTLVSVNLATFPALLIYGLAACAPVLTSIVYMRLGSYRRAAISSIIAAGMCASGVLLVAFELLSVVTPARVEMIGLLAAFGVCGSFWAAARATYAAGRVLWREACVIRRAALRRGTSGLAESPEHAGSSVQQPYP